MLVQLVTEFCFVFFLLDVGEKNNISDSNLKPS